MAQRGARRPQPPWSGSPALCQMPSSRCPSHTFTGDQRRVLPFREVPWGNFVKITLSGHSRSFSWLPWSSAFRCRLALEVLVQLNWVRCHGMVIKFILFVCSCYSRLSIKLIVHMHFHLLHAYILVHLTGEHKQRVLSDKLKCKGIN